MTPVTARRLAAIPGVVLYLDGDREKTFTFPVGLFPDVAALVLPKKRRRCHMTPEEKATFAARGREVLRQREQQRNGHSATSQGAGEPPEPHETPDPGL